MALYNGQLYAVYDNTLTTLNPVTGAITNVTAMWYVIASMPLTSLPPSLSHPHTHTILQVP